MLSDEVILERRNGPRRLSDNDDDDDEAYSELHCVSKMFPPLNSLYLCQILTDFRNICNAGKCMKFATKPFDTTHLTLRMLLHYLGKLKIQIFCRYSADMEDLSLIHI